MPERNLIHLFLLACNGVPKVRPVLDNKRYAVRWFTDLDSSFYIR
jgi:hypothetical protein